MFETEIKRIAVALGKIADAINSRAQTPEKPTSKERENIKKKMAEKMRLAKVNEFRLQQFVEHRKKTGRRYNEKPADPSLRWQKPKDEKPVTLLTGVV